MGKIIKAYKVTNFKDVDVTKYSEGDVFITDKHIGILFKGKIEVLNKTPNLSNYVRVKDVNKMIDDKLKEVIK